MTTTGPAGTPQRQPSGAEGGVALPESLTVLPDGSTPVPLGSGKITAVLGEGGAAIVYEVWNEQLGIKRAVKVLRPNAMPSSFERFTTEMRITAQLRHPNVIEIHSVGEWNRLPYIEMERLEGSSLDKVLTKHGALPVPVALAIGIMICRALKYTHNHDYAVNGEHYRGILHRDLKPANVMLADNGRVKLMDFGIATPTNASMHTMEGTFVGSLQYLAPEQLEGKKASTSTDLYAFGSLMYEMLTGHQAFPERNMTKLISMRLKNEFRPLADYRLRMPKHLLKIVNSCMAFERDRRAKDAAVVLTELEGIHAGYSRLQPEEMVELWLHKPAGKRVVTYQRRIPVMRLALSAAAVAAVAVGGYLGWQNREQIMSWRTVREVVREVVRDSVLVSTPSPAETVFVTKVEQRTAPAAPAPVKAATSTPAAKPTPAARSAPAPVVERREPSFLVKLTQQYGTDDLLAIMARELAQGNFGTALRVYDSLPAGQMRSKQALLYKLRGLQGLGNTAKLSEFFDANTVTDAEYYLAKAQYLQGRQQYHQALTQLDNCAASQAELADPRTIQRETVYYKALCLTGLYNQEQTDQSRQAAMASWYDVKLALKGEQSHRYFAYANEQIPPHSRFGREPMSMRSAWLVVVGCVCALPLAAASQDSTSAGAAGVVGASVPAATGQDSTFAGRAGSGGSDLPPAAAPSMNTLSGNLPARILASGSPYIVTGPIVVPPGETVTLEPGVFLLFRNFTGLQVHGSLIAVGTKEHPIAFTSENDKMHGSVTGADPAPFDWDGITITENAAGTTLEYCRIGYSVYGVNALTEYFTIRNCMFRKNGKGCVTVKGAKEAVTEGVPFSYEPLGKAPVLAKNRASAGKITLRTSSMVVFAAGCAVGVWQAVAYSHDSQHFQSVNDASNIANLRNPTIVQDWNSAKHARDSDLIGIIAGFGGAAVGGIVFTITLF